MAHSEHHTHSGLNFGSKISRVDEDEDDDDNGAVGKKEDMGIRRSCRLRQRIASIDSKEDDQHSSSETISTIVTSTTTSTSCPPSPAFSNQAYLNFFREQVRNFQHSQSDEVGGIDGVIDQNVSPGDDPSTDLPRHRRKRNRRTTTQFAMYQRRISTLWKKLTIGEKMNYEDRASSTMKIVPLSPPSTMARQLEGHRTKVFAVKLSSTESTTKRNSTTAATTFPSSNPSLRELMRMRHEHRRLKQPSMHETTAERVNDVPESSLNNTHNMTTRTKRSINDTTLE